MQRSNSTGHGTSVDHTKFGEHHVSRCNTAALHTPELFIRSSPLTHTMESLILGISKTERANGTKKWDSLDEGRMNDTMEQRQQPSPLCCFVRGQRHITFLISHTIRHQVSWCFFVSRQGTRYKACHRANISRDLTSRNGPLFLT